MIGFLINLIDIIAKLLSLLVIVHVILSYFVSPYHSIRIQLARVVEPMLAPIRKIIPTVQGFDFSPFILILLIQLIELLLVNILRG